MTDTKDRRTFGRLTLGLALAALVGAIALGAYLDWEWWEPYSGILITLAAGALVVIALLAFAVRRPGPRRAGVVIGAVAAGLLVGQNFGPARELPSPTTGTLTVRLDSPVAAEGTMEAQCSSTADAAQLLVSSDGDVRADDYAVTVEFSRGDMWRPVHERDDGLEVRVLAFVTGPIPDDGAPTEVAMVSDASSTIGADVQGRSGVVTFDGLVRNDRYQTGAGQVDPVEFAGTIEFSCETPSSIER